MRRPWLWHDQMILTTNLPFKQWSTVFPGAACVAALVDRFVQHCHVVDIDGDSWRQKDSNALAEQRANAPPSAVDPAVATTSSKKR
jgi:IstB-like ATP binding protein